VKGYVVDIVGLAKAKTARIAISSQALRSQISDFKFQISELRSQISDLSGFLFCAEGDDEDGAGN